MMQGFNFAGARIERVLGVAAWMACAVFLSGCNGYSDDYIVSSPRGQQMSGAGDRAELARAADKYVAASTPGSMGYKVGPQDVLDITVFQAPELTRVIQVSEAGTINLPLAGELVASGHTASEVEHILASRLGAKYLKSPQVTVFVKEYNSQRVTVGGSVKKPGVYPLRGHDTLMQAIAKAEGLDRETASSNVVIFRTDNGVRSAIRFDLGDIRSGGTQDPPVRAGDVIVVDDSMTKSAFQVFIKLLPLGTTAAYVF